MFKKQCLEVDFKSNDITLSCVVCQQECQLKCKFNIVQVFSNFTWRTQSKRGNSSRVLG